MGEKIKIMVTQQDVQNAEQRVADLRAQVQTEAQKVAALEAQRLAAVEQRRFDEEKKLREAKRRINNRIDSLRSSIKKQNTQRDKLRRQLTDRVKREAQRKPLERPEQFARESLGDVQTARRLEEARRREQAILEAREQRAQQTVQQFATQQEVQREQLSPQVEREEAPPRIALFTDEQLRTQARGFELRQRTERLGRAQEEFFRTLGLEGEGTFREVGRTVAASLNPALFGATLAAGAESALFLRDFRRSFGAEQAPTNLELAGEVGQQTGRILTFRDPLTGEVTPGSVTLGSLIFGGAFLGARAPVRAPAPAETIVGRQTTLPGGSTVRTVSITADQPAPIISPETSPSLARFPTGERTPAQDILLDIRTPQDVIFQRARTQRVTTQESVPEVQETLVPRGDRSVRRVTPEEALQLEDRTVKLDEIRQFIPEPEPRAPFEVRPTTETRQTIFGEVQVTRPTRQQSILSFEDFSTPIESSIPPSTLDPVLPLAGRRAQVPLSLPKPVSLPKLPRPSPQERPVIAPAPTPQQPSPTSFRVSPLTTFIGELQPGATPTPLTEERLSIQERFDQDIRPSQQQRPALEPTLELIPVQDVTPIQRSGGGQRSRTDQTPEQQQPPILINPPIIDQPQLTPQTPVPPTPPRTPPSLVPELRIPRIPPPTRRPDRPFTPRNVLPRFRVTVGRPGNLVFRELGLGGRELIARAKSLVESGAAASFRVTGDRVDTRNILSGLGSSFRLSKVDPFRFVQRRERRLSSPGELLEVGGRSKNRFKLKGVKLRL